MQLIWGFAGRTYHIVGNLILLLIYYCFSKHYFFHSFLSLYTARPSFEYYRHVYFVHLGLQDESLQVTISRLPWGSFTCTGGDFPCIGDIQLTSQSEGRCNYLMSSLQMTLEKWCSDIYSSLQGCGNTMSNLVPFCSGQVWNIYLLVLGKVWTNIIQFYI